MGTPETSREPCPDRILDDIGGAFGMGAVGGSAFHLIKGVYNSPNGERLAGGLQSVRMNAPRVGGGFAVWGGLFSPFDCTMVYLRQKEDPWNSILAGAATGGFLSMRMGPASAGRAAVFGGVLLALIEGAGIMLNRVMSAPQNFPGVEDANVAGMMAAGGGGVVPPGFLPPGVGPANNPAAVAADGGSPSWFGGWFGGGKKGGEGKSGGGGGKTEVLESFDSPSMPVPSFEYK